MKVSNLSAEIAKALSQYTTEVTEGLEKSKKQVAKDAAKQLKSTSPKDKGDYAKGWKAKKVGTSWTVHNATNYQITHLLENGHAKIGGGRVSGTPHIRPAEQTAIESFERLLEKVIKG